MSCRNHKRIIKPQFFESYRSERNHLVLLDAAAGYVVKKAVAASVSLAERDLKYCGPEMPWGGMASKLVLAAELIPMMVKIQSLTKGDLLLVIL